MIKFKTIKKEEPVNELECVSAARAGFFNVLNQLDPELAQIADSTNVVKFTSELLNYVVLDEKSSQEEIYIVRSMLISIFEDRANDFFNKISITANNFLKKYSDAVNSILCLKDPLYQPYTQLVAEQNFKRDSYMGNIPEDKLTNSNFSTRFSFLKNIALTFNFVETETQIESVTAAIVSVFESALNDFVVETTYTEETPELIYNLANLRTSLLAEFANIVFSEIVVLSKYYAETLINIGNGEKLPAESSKIALPLSTGIKMSVPLQYHAIAKMTYETGIATRNTFVRPIKYAEKSSDSLD